MTVEQLDDARRLADRARALLDAAAREWIDQPDAPARNKSVRATLNELIDDPAEDTVELIAEPDMHAGDTMGTP